MNDKYEEFGGEFKNEAELDEEFDEEGIDRDEAEKNILKGIINDR